MPLPKDFQVSQNVGFVEKGKVVDYNPNTSKEVTYPNGESYPKNPNSTYVDIKIKVESGEDKGKTFVQENINTGIYKSARGRSQFYIWLGMLGVSEEKLDELAAQQKPAINIMQTVGKSFDGVRKNKDGELYVDLRDPENIKTKAEVSDTSIDDVFKDDDDDSSEQTEEINEVLDDLFS